MKRNYIRFLPAWLFLGIAVASPHVAAADRLVPGEWEFTNKTGRDSYAYKKCLKDADAAQVNGEAAAARAAMEKDMAGRCTVESFAVNQNTVDYILVCASQRIQSSTDYRGERSEATITVSAGTDVTTSTVKGRRLGPCRP